MFSNKVNSFRFILFPYLVNRSTGLSFVSCLRLGLLVPFNHGLNYLTVSVCHFHYESTGLAASWLLHPTGKMEHEHFGSAESGYSDQQPHNIGAVEVPCCA